MKKVHCYEEGYCYTEENGQLELLTPFSQKWIFVGVSTILLAFLASTLF